MPSSSVPCEQFNKCPVQFQTENSVIFVTYPEMSQIVDDLYVIEFRRVRYSLIWPAPSKNVPYVLSVGLNTTSGIYTFK